MCHMMDNMNYAGLGNVEVPGCDFGMNLWDGDKMITGRARGIKKVKCD